MEQLAPFLDLCEGDAREMAELITDDAHAVCQKILGVGVGYQTASAARSSIRRFYGVEGTGNPIVCPEATSRRYILLALRWATSPLPAFTIETPTVPPVGEPEPQLAPEQSDDLVATALDRIALDLLRSDQPEAAAAVARAADLVRAR
jgi:hypothetical protein